MSATKDSIITLPHADLRLRSKRVGLITDEIKQLVQDMEDAVVDWDSSRDHEVTVALAAVQIDQLYRVVIVREDFDHKVEAQYTALINPEIVKYEGEVTRDYEGCLSIKSVYGFVPRHEKVRIKALSLSGKPVRFSASGFLARVLQHEVDHTNGKLFIDHIKDDHDAFYVLTDKGKLDPLDYDKDIKDNQDLWG